jgi:hypothetical protein
LGVKEKDTGEVVTLIREGRLRWGFYQQVALAPTPLLYEKRALGGIPRALVKTLLQAIFSPIPMRKLLKNKDFF